MCYFTNDFLSEISLREELQQNFLNGDLNLDFYSRLKQLNLLNLNKNYSEKFIDAENSIRNIMASFLILLNSNAFIKTKIKPSRFSYLINEFSFELTLCENICNAIKHSSTKYLYIKTRFSSDGFKIIIVYSGKPFMPRNYSHNTAVNARNLGFLNKVTLDFNSITKQKQKPPKINLDGYIKNRLSSVYITLYLSGLKRFN